MYKAFSYFLEEACNGQISMNFFKKRRKKTFTLPTQKLQLRPFVAPNLHSLGIKIFSLNVYPNNNYHSKEIYVHY